MHIFDYDPITKYEEMPETVDKEKARVSWEAEPIVVGGKTKYPMFNPPAQEPVR